MGIVPQAHTVDSPNTEAVAEVLLYTNTQCTVVVDYSNSSLMLVKEEVKQQRGAGNPVLTCINHKLTLHTGYTAMWSSNMYCNI